MPDIINTSITTRGVTMDVNLDTREPDPSKTANYRKVDKDASTELVGRWIDSIKKASSDGSLNAAVTAWQSGEPISEADMQKIMALANKLSPSVIQQLVANGDMTQDQANALIMVQGMSQSMAPQNNDLIQNGMANFYRLSPDDQAFALSQMKTIDIPFTGVAMQQTFGDPHPGEPTFGYYLSTQNNTDKQQQLATYYLSTMSPNDKLGNFQAVVNGTADAGDPIAQAVYAMPGYQNLSPEDQKSLNSFLSTAAAIPTSDVDKRASLSDQYKQLSPDVKKLMDMSIADLFFLICQNNTKVTGDVIRSKGIKQYNDMNDYGDCVSAMAALSAAENPDSKGKTDIEKVTFQDHNGETVKLVDWLQEKGIEYGGGLDDDQQKLYNVMKDPDSTNAQFQDAFEKVASNTSKNPKMAKLAMAAMPKKADKVTDKKTAGQKDAIMANLESVKNNLTSTQVDSLTNTMKNWSTKQRDNNQLNQNDLTRETQLFQQYTSEGTTGMQLMTENQLKGVRTWKVQ